MSKTRRVLRCSHEGGREGGWVGGKEEEKEGGREGREGHRRASKLAAGEVLYLTEAVQSLDRALIEP
jgi:hypothetical protein